jgi:hypothetical protein
MKLLRPAAAFELPLLLAIVLLSRLLFLSPGYGSEDDSWGLILNAREMWATGQYSFSRLPGHPVQEYVLYCLPESLLNPWFCNFLSALFSAAAAGFFYALLKHFQAARPFLWTLVFACVPMVWISGTYTIDYSWGLCFQLGAFWAVLRRRLLPAAVCLGLAAGCRMPAGAFGLVLLPFLYEGNLKASILRALRLGLPAILIAVLCYTPALLRYGSAFFDFYTLPYPSIAKTAYKATFGLWGFSGTLALLLFPIAWRNATIQPALSQATALCLLVFGLGFIVYPHKSAFLLPVVPMIILVFAVSTHRFASRNAPLLFLLAPVYLGLNFSDPERGATPSMLSIPFRAGNETLFVDLLQGPLVMEQSRRENRLRYCQAALERCETLPNNAVVLCGWWTNQMRELALPQRHFAELRFDEFLSPRQLMQYHSAKRPVFYLDEIDRVNDERYGMVFTAQWAKALDEN